VQSVCGQLTQNGPMIVHKVETTHVLFNNNYQDQGQRALSDQHLGSGVESLIYDRYIASASVERSAIGRPPGGRIGARAISRGTWITQ